MKLEEAKAFFAELYFGEHHFPSDLVPWGEGWMMRCDQKRLHTYDYNHLTRFVLMCHEYGIRGEIQPHTFRHVKIIIHKRTAREGSVFEVHPTIHTAIKKYEAYEHSCRTDNQRINYHLLETGKLSAEEVNGRLQ